MLGLGSYDDSDEDEEAAVAPAPLSIPAIAQQVAESSDEEDDDNAESSAAVAAAVGRESDEEGGGGMLPSMDEALGAAPLDNPFEAAESAAPAYGTIFDDDEEEEEGGDDPKSAAAAAVAAAAAASGAGSSAGGAPEWSALHPERKAETTRQRNARKEKLGQATFSLKWDRDTGAEKASGGIDSSANLQSRTMPKQSHRQASRGNPDAQSIKVREPSKGVSKREQESLKDRTKLKRQKDQSASFLGGRWKTEQEMHMRDFFDS